MTPQHRRPELDPDAARFLARLKAAGLPPIDKIPLQQARLVSASTVVTADPLRHVEDRTIISDGRPLKLRIYRPDAAPSPLPAIVFFHGGGWVFGSLDSHDGLCRRLCRLSRSAVISVDYRLAPENPFPAAVHDAEAAVRWVSTSTDSLGFDATRLVVCGDSAGANLATVAARRLLGTVNVAAQILWYPVASFFLETPSYLENSEGYFLSRDEMSWFSSQYLPSPEDGQNPDAAPLFAPDLTGMPRTYLLTAGYDPLRDDGRAYAKRLIEAGVSVHFTERSGLIHGFMRRLDDFQAATEELEEVSHFLNGVWAAHDRGHDGKPSAW
jgi:acetyl esterase